MSKIKFTRQDIYKKVIKLHGVNYVHYTIATLPVNFGCQTTRDGKQGLPSFFNYKGLTYIPE